jgi:DNA-binding transcriptional regulator LsrR (DeoR family)
MTPAEHARANAKAAKAAKRLYAEHRSIREISEQLGISYGKVRKLLVDGGVELRPRGGRKLPAVR